MVVVKIFISGSITTMTRLDFSKYVASDYMMKVRSCIFSGRIVRGTIGKSCTMMTTRQNKVPAIITWT